MQFIVFGAGVRGKDALNNLSHPRVKCFLDNDINKKEYLGKRVISFDDLTHEDIENSIFVIASDDYWQEMELELKAIPGIRYFIYRKDEPYEVMLPHYYLNKSFETASYNRALSAFDISKYGKISILGSNVRLPYLISEVAMQNSFDSIVEIIGCEDSRVQNMGIPVVSWEEADKDIECLIVNIEYGRLEVFDQVTSLAKNVKVINLYADADIVEPSFYHAELEKFKDVHKGGRIFIIGNGPSLRVEDLEKLQKNGDITIAFNKIYRLYPKTSWRATYLGYCDQNAIKELKSDWECLEGDVFIGDSYHYELPEQKLEFENANYFHIISGGRLQYPMGAPCFSADLRRGAYEGFTSTYSIGFQMAAFMGAKEIYLLGVDFNYSSNVDINSNYSIKGYYTEEEESRRKTIYTEETLNTVMGRQQLAYYAAKVWAEKLDIKIYNATRGGKLEVFERVDFDSLF